MKKPVSGEEMTSTKPAFDNNVAILCTYTESYCGGAEPPEEMLRELSTPRPLAGEELFVRSGTENNVAQPILFKGKTNADGILLLNLTPGDYVVVRADKKDNSHYEDILKKYSTATTSTGVVDKDCLSNWLKSPELIMHVEEGHLNSFSFNAHKPCSWNALPCVPYFGPYPP